MHTASFQNWLRVASMVAVVSGTATGGPARADFTITAAGRALGLSVTTFATGFPSAYSVGPLGIAFLGNGGVLVTDYPGHIRLLPSDSDGQVARAPLHSYGLGNAHDLATSGGHIYMTQKYDGDLVQINANGTINHTVASGLDTPLAVVADPANGHLFVSTRAGIVEVDPTTGSKTILVGRSADGLTITHDGRTIYGEINSHILGFSTATGLQVFDSGFIGGHPDGTVIGLGPFAGNIFANCNNGSLVEINMLTSVQTVIGTGGTRGDFVAVDPNDGTLLLTQTDRILRLHGANFVPEPSSVALLGLGALGGLLALRRRGDRPARD